MTKEYLKMADVFNKQDSIVPESKMVEYAAHAIDSHDELVEDVEQLRESNRRMATAIWGKWQREGVMANESSQDKADAFRELYLCEPFTHPE